MDNAEPLRIPFRASISAVFILITIPLILAIIGILYVRNAQLARDLATDEMNRATTNIANHIEGLLSPLARVVEATAALGRIDRGALRRVDAFQYFLAVLESTPQADSIYVGFAPDGAFYQASRLSPALKQFGPSGAKPPQGARFALRILDASSSERADSFIYLAKWGDVVAVERGAATFDPRERPWYEAAWSRPGPSLSDAYVFFSSSQPGITLSESIATKDGIAIGAAGVDISLTELSAFLAHERIGRHGLVFVVDGDGRLIGYPKLDTIVRQRNGAFILARADEVDDPLVATAVARRSDGQGERFSLDIGGDTYRVAFSRLPLSFGKDWSVGVIASEGDFVDPIRRASLFMLGLGGCVVILSLLTILWVSRSLTRPIKQVVGEMRRIRTFQLSGASRIESRIIEIHELARAVEAMEEGLRSFGAYIPKALVRTIIASGRGTNIGGERRCLTILFTDIKDFTHLSEGLAPEDVLEQLSSYFDAMSRCIHDCGGTVDKFIGDAVMAFWNAPLANPDHTAKACEAVLRCREANADLNARWLAEGSAPMPTRFGLHSGDTVVGNVGSADRMQYTALGSEVNLASRVEGLNKIYGTQIIATGAVEAQVRDRFLFRPLDLVVPAGTTQITPIFELVGPLLDGPDGAGDAEIARCTIWGNAIALYRRRMWRDALAAFRRFAQEHPQDSVASLYVARCERFADAPPATDWDGAEHFDVK
jgi:adenylate cyclase